MVRPIRRISAASSTVRNAGNGPRTSPTAGPGNGVGMGGEELVDGVELWSMACGPFRSEWVDRLAVEAVRQSEQPA